MTTLLLTHPVCIEHSGGLHHPESPARLKAVLAALAAPEFSALQREEAPPASDEQLARVHPQAYIDRIVELAPTEGLVRLDADTAMCPATLEAARRAAGAVCAAVDAVIEGRAENAFCAVRPPGHHAEPARPMGFCIFNSVAVGALHARQAHGLQRIAVVDFDVHHGNGTEASFRADANLVYVSTHQSPLYPGTGAYSDRGVGNIYNAPLPPFSGSEAFREVFSGMLLPALGAFRPEMLLISAGFDAHKDDPLANLELVEDDYAWITAELMELAGRHAGGRIVSTLEGGYNLAALAASAAAHVGTLMAV